MKLRRKIKYFVENFPGFKRVGPYAFMPVFFLCGAALEFAMIKWEPNGHNFYSTYKKRQVEERAQHLFEEYLKNTKLSEELSH